MHDHKKFPAFPYTLINDTQHTMVGPGDVHCPPGEEAQYSGMTVMEFVTSQALVGILANRKSLSGSFLTPQEVANEAVAVASATLDLLHKTGKPK